jgi:hypothetical protein
VGPVTLERLERGAELGGHELHFSGWILAFIAQATGLAVTNRLTNVAGNYI